MSIDNDDRSFEVHNSQVPSLEAMDETMPPLTPRSEDTSADIIDAPAAPAGPPRFSNLETRDAFGKKMLTVEVTPASQHQPGRYFIGVQIAHFLKRETFNLYRSMKLSSIAIIKCQPDEIEELTQIDAIKRGIHSVTLVPYDAGLKYIDRELKRKPRKKGDKRGRLGESGDSPRGSPYLRPRNSLPLMREEDSEEDIDDEEDIPSDVPGSPEEQLNRNVNAFQSEEEQRDANKLLHWKKLLLVASLERMKMSGSSLGIVA
jgi:hypothetical protein